MTQLELPLLQIGAVFLMGAAPWLEIWIAVPAGVLMGLSPPVALFAAVLGNFLAVLGIALFIPGVRAWFVKRYLPVTPQGQEPTKRQRRFFYLWERYGVPGTTMAAPLLVGTHLAAVLCLVLGSSTKKVLWWIAVSITVWGLVMLLLTYTGLEGYRYLFPVPEADI